MPPEKMSFFEENLAILACDFLQEEKANNIKILAGHLHVYHRVLQGAHPRE